MAVEGQAFAWAPDTVAGASKRSILPTFERHRFVAQCYRRWGLSPPCDPRDIAFLEGLTVCSATVDASRIESGCLFYPRIGTFRVLGPSMFLALAQHLTGGTGVNALALALDLILPEWTARRGLIEHPHAPHWLIETIVANARGSGVFSRP